jgi:hypothetical protein
VAELGELALESIPSIRLDWPAPQGVDRPT